MLSLLELVVVVKEVQEASTVASYLEAALDTTRGKYTAAISSNAEFALRFAMLPQMPTAASSVTAPASDHRNNLSLSRLCIPFKICLIS